MDDKVEEVVSNFRIFAKDMRKGKKRNEKSYCCNLFNMKNKSMRPEMHELAKKVFKVKEGKEEFKYAACFWEYFPKECDADQETREGC
eukprot:8734362-Ditylum_brightwellii.AAC.1